VSFLTTPLSIAGWIDDPDHSLTSGMYVDVPNFDCLLIAPSITVEGLDHLILKPKELDGVVAISVDVVLGHVLNCRYFDWSYEVKLQAAPLR
jgi:hypothetical protein